MRLELQSVVHQGKPNGYYCLALVEKDHTYIGLTDHIPLSVDHAEEIRQIIKMYEKKAKPDTIVIGVGDHSIEAVIHPYGADMKTIYWNILKAHPSATDEQLRQIVTFATAYKEWLPDNHRSQAELDERIKRAEQMLAERKPKAWDDLDFDERHEILTDYIKMQDSEELVQVIWRGSFTESGIITLKDHYEGAARRQYEEDNNLPITDLEE